MVPDYYARLEVDPGASSTEIEAALKRLQPRWSMGTRNPKTRHTNQLYLDEVPALRRALLSGPGARAAYDAELAAAKAAERESRLDQLQQRIRLRAAKGGLTPSDRALLQEEAIKLSLDEEVVERLTRLIPAWSDTPVAELVEETDPAPPSDVLDPSTRRQIRGALEHLGRRDLYDALSVFRDAPLSIISARADEERQRWMKKAQVTAEKTAWLEIISHAQTHLTSSKARARYDRTLELEAEERLDAVMAFALKGMKRLDAGTRAAIVDEASALGILAHRAEGLIARACRKLGVAQDLGFVPPIAMPPSPSTASVLTGTGAPASANGSPQILRCRSCSGVTELSPIARRTSAGRCRHCGASLKWECPICHRTHWVDEPRCDCGLPLPLREPLVHHFTAAQHAFRTHDLAAAREHLERVQQFAPHHVGARNGLAKIRQRLAEIESARMAFELAMAGKKLVAARRAAQEWRKLIDPSDPEVQGAWGRVSAGLKQAAELAARGRKLERANPPAARDLYRKALEIAVDFPDALDGLNRCPPDAAIELKARVLSDRVRLSWTPPPPDGLGPLTYAVLRKHGGLPQHPADGTRIAEVSMCEYDDRHVKAGESVSYAVMTRRGNAESLAAVAVGPVVYLPDVQDVRVETREGEIGLSWIPPHGVLEVRVVRKEDSPPSDPRDGTRISASLDQATDSRLSPERVYHYGIYAIYRMPDGARFPSAGEFVAAHPRPPLPPLEAPRVSLNSEGHARIEWYEPPRGSVRIFRTTQPLPWTPGTRLLASEVGALPGVWIEPKSSEHAEDQDAPGIGLCYYTPMVALGESLTVGHSSELSRIPDPSDLRASRLGGSNGDGMASSRVQLRWQWAPQADATRIVARQGQAPEGSADVAGIVTTVSREEYERQRSWTLILPNSASPTSGLTDKSSTSLSSNGTSPASEAWYVRVYSVVDHEGKWLTSPGQEPTAVTSIPGPHPEVTVSYGFRRPWIPGRSWSLVMKTEPAGALVPPMVLVANARAVPLSPEDGEIVAWLPACRDGARHVIRGSHNLSRSVLRVFPDPLAEPGSFSPIRLRHPETGTPRA
jgi:hypothetical protein